MTQGLSCYCCYNNFQNADIAKSAVTKNDWNVILRGHVTSCLTYRTHRSFSMCEHVCLFVLNITDVSCRCLWSLLHIVCQNQLRLLDALPVASSEKTGKRSTAKLTEWNMKSAWSVLAKLGGLRKNATQRFLAACQHGMINTSLLHFKHCIWANTLTLCTAPSKNVISSWHWSNRCEAFDSFSLRVPICEAPWP